MHVHRNIRTHANTSAHPTPHVQHVDTPGCVHIAHTHPHIPHKHDCTYTSHAHTPRMNAPTHHRTHLYTHCTCTPTNTHHRNTPAHVCTRVHTPHTVVHRVAACSSEAPARGRKHREVGAEAKPSCGASTGQGGPQTRFQPPALTIAPVGRPLPLGGAHQAVWSSRVLKALGSRGRAEGMHPGACAHHALGTREGLWGPGL